MWRPISVTGRGRTGITMLATLMIKILSEGGDHIPGWWM
jgi:CO dehydrogenase nickel-insertion accessory protein CooC1